MTDGGTVGDLLTRCSCCGGEVDAEEAYTFDDSGDLMCEECSGEDSELRLEGWNT